MEPRWNPPPIGSRKQNWERNFGVHYSNRSPQSQLSALSCTHDQVPLTHLKKRLPSLRHPRILQSITYAVVPDAKWGRPDLQSAKCIKPRYKEEASCKVYHVFNPTSKRPFSSVDGIINELGYRIQVSYELKIVNSIKVFLHQQGKGVEKGIHQRQLEQRLPSKETNDQANSREFGGDLRVIRSPGLVHEASRNCLSEPELWRSQGYQYWRSKADFTGLMLISHKVCWFHAIRSFNS